MKHLYITLLLLASCGKKSTDNFTNVNCDTVIVTDYVEQVLPSELEERLDEIEEEGGVVTEVTEPEDFDATAKAVINYQVEQCNGNGNISDDDGNVSNSNNGDEYDY